MTRVALLTPNWRLADAVFPTDTLRPPPSYPIEWGYFTGSLQRARSVICDEYFHDHTFEQTATEVSSARADVVVVSTTPSYLFWRCPPLSIDLVSRYVRLCRRVAPTARVLLIGPHSTTDPLWVLRKTKADYAFRGEPDPHLPAALDELPGDSLDRCPWVARANHAAQVAPQESFAEGRMADYSPLLHSAYPPHMWGAEGLNWLKSVGIERGALLESSRGCSFDCDYCFRSGFRNRLRTKPLAVLAGEVESVRAAGIRYVFLIDETFGMPWPHAQATAQLLHDADVRYGIQTRPDVLTAPRIEHLRATGCVYAEIGIEANEPEYLERLGKYRNTTAAYQLLSLLRESIPFVNSNILDLGNPDYLPADGASPVMQVDNSGNAPPPFIPYPTTPGGERVIASYRRDGEASWETAEDIYLVFSLMSRSALFRRLLLPSLRRRRLAHRVLRHLKRPVSRWTHFVQSRFERLYYDHSRSRSSR